MAGRRGFVASVASPNRLFTILGGTLVAAILGAYGATMDLSQDDAARSPLLLTVSGYLVLVSVAGVWAEHERGELWPSGRVARSRRVYDTSKYQS